MKKRYPHIVEEISRHSWAITGAALDAILRAVENGLGNEDTPIFHGALDEMRAEMGEPNPKEFHHGLKVGRVGVIRVEGPIMPRASWLTEASGITSSEAIGADLAKMDADAEIEKIAMIFDTPGGAVTGTSDVVSQIRAMNKPVISYIFGMAASAGYWIAAATDEIVSSDTGIVGSIGTILAIENDKDEKLIKIVSSQAPLKDADPESEEGAAHYQGVVDALEVVFIGAVAIDRGTTPENVSKNFGRGGILVAAEAKERGMIDRISTFADFMADLQAADPARWQSRDINPPITAEENKIKVKAVDNSFKIGGNDFKEILTPNAEGDHSMDEKKTLKEFLAENPSAFSEHKEMIASACEEAGKNLRAELGIAANVCASEDYPKSVRAIAVEVIEGKRSQAALDGAMAAAEITKEGAASVAAVAASGALPETLAQNAPTVSSDGVVSTMADLEAALPKKIKR